MRNSLAAVLVTTAVIWSAQPTVAVAQGTCTGERTTVTGEVESLSSASYEYRIEGQGWMIRTDILIHNGCRIIRIAGSGKVPLECQTGKFFRATGTLYNFDMAADGTNSHGLYEVTNIRCY
jgi:hypothetical protein